MERTAERESVINQYNIYSKKAANLLTVLIFYSIFFGYALVERHFENAEIEKSWQCELRTVEIEHGLLNKQNYSWDNDLKPVEPLVIEPSFKREQHIPFINIEISGVAFFFFGPVVYFILTIIYWMYLSSSLKLLNRLKRFLNPKEKIKHFCYPCIYNTIIESLRIKTFWQLVLELFPVIFLVLIFITYFPNIYNMYYYSILISIFIFISVIVHSLLFNIMEFKFDFGLLVITIISSIALIDILLFYYDPYNHYSSQSFGNKYINQYINVAFFSIFIELIMLRTNVISRILFYPIMIFPTIGNILFYLIQSFLSLFFSIKKSKFKDIISEYFERPMWYSRYEIGGYIGYYRKRKRELEEMG